MDTGTHLVFGFGLAGLAYIDPVVASSPLVATAVLIGTIVGQQAPDLDTVMRLKGNASYIKNHRGLSHSIPAIAVWTLLITFALNFIFAGLPLLHVGFWVFLAVFIHVFTDMFNAYGTQAIRPFSKKWVAWNIIHIFDPIIFISHVIAIILWAAGSVQPAVIFPVLYAGIAIYYILRSVQHTVWEHRLPQLDQTYVQGEKFMLIPTIHPVRWNVIKRKHDNSYVLGELRSGWLHWVDKSRNDNHPAIEASKSHADIKAFLSFTSFVCAEVRHHKWGYEVRWADVRCHHRKNFPFVAVLLMDKNLEPLDSYVGWMNEIRIEEKLGLGTNY